MYREEKMGSGKDFQRILLPQMASEIAAFAKNARFFGKKQLTGKKNML